jgi:eukaryotic translation initiation factor 2C
LLLQDPVLNNPDNTIASDETSTIISVNRLSLPPDGIINVKFRFEDESEPRDDAETYRFKVQETGFINVSDLVNYLQSADTGLSFASKEEVLQALNIAMSRYPTISDKIAIHGANRYFPLGAGTERYDLGRGLMALKGFFTSVRTATHRLLLNVNLSNAVSYDDIPLSRLIDVYKAKEASNPLLHKFLHGIRVLVKYTSTNHMNEKKIMSRTRVVYGLASTKDGSTIKDVNKRPQVSHLGANVRNVIFWRNDEHSDKGGVYTSIEDYFSTVHRVTISSPGHLVNIGNRDHPVYMPADFCHVLPGQFYNGVLTPSQTQEMLKVACRKPADNARSIMQEGIQVLGFSNGQQASVSGHHHLIDIRISVIFRSC